MLSTSDDSNDDNGSPNIRSRATASHTATLISERAGKLHSNADTPLRQYMYMEAASYRILETLRLVPAVGAAAEANRLHGINSSEGNSRAVTDRSSTSAVP
jgi:hypothetical protein